MLRVAGLPDALAGLRIGFMTDLHRSSTVPHELIELAASLLMAERPDSSCSAGTTSRGAGLRPRRATVTSWSRRPTRCASLSAPHGVFGVLGNHDDDRDMPAAMAARGVEMLKDARTRLTIQRRGTRPHRDSILDDTRPRHRRARARRGAGVDPARAQSVAPQGSRRACRCRSC